MRHFVSAAVALVFVLLGSLFVAVPSAEAVTCGPQTSKKATVYMVLGEADDFADHAARVRVYYAKCSTGTRVDGFKEYTFPWTTNTGAFSCKFAGIRDWTFNPTSIAGHNYGPTTKACTDKGVVVTHNFANRITSDTCVTSYGRTDIATWPDRTFIITVCV